MKLLQKITQGSLLVVIGLMHTQFALSGDGFGQHFIRFSQDYFFNVQPGMSDFPIHSGKMDFEHFAAFWFFYFGVLLIPLGIVVHFLEKRLSILPLSFTLSYLGFVLLGCYMIPNSGMTYFMLPQAVFMFCSHLWKQQKLKKTSAFTSA